MGIRRMPTVIFPIVFLSSCASVLAQVDTSDAALAGALRMVIDFAQDDFADLRGELAMSTRVEQWNVLFALPGFDECYLVHQPRRDSRRSYQRDYFSYQCTVSFPGDGVIHLDGRGSDKLEEKYSQILAAVGWATSWPSIDSDSQTAMGKIFTEPDSALQRSIRVDDMWFSNAMRVGVFPRNQVIFSRDGAGRRPVSDSESQIRKEIERVESSGAASRLTAPLTLGRLSSRPGASWTLDNRTAYFLVILLTGPIVKRIVVPSGAKKTCEMPAGRYKVLARLIAPEFPPLFDIQEYASGHEYKSDFVIE